MRSKPSPGKRSTVELLKSAQAGSAEAIGQILETCRTYLVLVAREEINRELQAKVGASDLVQETFVVAQRDFRRFRGDRPEDLLAWLRGILLNKVQEARRSFQTGKRHVAREVPLDGAKSTARNARERAAKSSSPSRQAAATEEAERILLALASLSDEHQQVIRLRNWKLLPFEEIGRIMSRTSGAARALWVRALEQLAAAMEASDGK